MNKFSLGTALFSAVTLLSVGHADIAQAQLNPPFKGAPVPKPRQTQPVVRQGRGPGDLYVGIPLDVMNMYLKLDKGQSEKIGAILKKFSESQGKLLTMGTGDATKVQQEVLALQTLMKQSETDIEATLTIDQKKKAEPMFEEVRKLSSVGIVREEIADVKLDEAQKKKLLTLADEYAKKRAEIKAEERQTEGPKLGKEYRGKAAELLTAEQKATIEKAREKSAFRRPQPR